ncbi:velvet factor-domain-containing protein [Geopyxis carbonaria]|nr:velvet factor-domain-containing protein [Geopyxis carbonaria]
MAETHAVLARPMPDGSTLEYRLSVLQQPERARACGQGPKSHADRRPVDPPPVVELRLIHGGHDVTFSHNSNFILFATLEHGRAIAPVRGIPAPAPVLTGVSVSGMAYLDRPQPAGYFIFPDLSVRHEGKYRLRFALYEESKEPAPAPAPGRDPLEPTEFCTHRVDVKSRPFTVFSAKRFPGLAESTGLSRVVAEQGCRVRIRRDARVRIRPELRKRRKGGAAAGEEEADGEEVEEEMDETAIRRAQRNGRRERDQYDAEREIEQQRRQQVPTPQPQVQAQAQVYPPPPPPQQQVQQSASQHLQFGQPQQAGAYAHPPQPPPQPPPQHQQHHQPQQQPQHQPPPQQHQQHHQQQQWQQQTPPPQQHQQASVGYDYPPPRRASDAAPGYYAPPPQHQPQHQQYRPPTPTYHHQAYTPSPQQHQPAYPPPPPPQQQQYAPHPHHHQPPPQPQPQQQQQQPYPPLRHRASAPSLPPLSAALPPLRLPPLSAPPPPSASQFAPYYTPAAPPPPAPASQAPPPPLAKKRHWNRVFNASHTEGALAHGARPGDDVYGADALLAADSEDEDGGSWWDESERLKMSYRRADGVEIVRRLPQE